jgi:hypothetical protein
LDSQANGREEKVVSGFAFGTPFSQQRTRLFPPSAITASVLIATPLAQEL